MTFNDISKETLTNSFSSLAKETLTNSFSSLAKENFISVLDLLELLANRHNKSPAEMARALLSHKTELELLIPLMKVEKTVTMYEPMNVMQWQSPMTILEKIANYQAMTMYAEMITGFSRFHILRLLNKLDFMIDDSEISYHEAYHPIQYELERLQPKQLINYYETLKEIITKPKENPTLGQIVNALGGYISSPLLLMIRASLAINFNDTYSNLKSKSNKIHRFTKDEQGYLTDLQHKALRSMINDNGAYRAKENREPRNIFDIAVDMDCLIISYSNVAFFISILSDCFVITY
ncbi:MAG: hypothetical protein Q4D05_03255 [Acinetobacter sp.]|nr:hypothetical protein [Acinetobacter sp.]